MRASGSGWAEVGAALGRQPDADFITAAPADIAALLAEVERLRGINVVIVLRAAQERAAVVAYLRGIADDYGVCIDLSLAEQADKIERGEHRRDGEKP